MARFEGHEDPTKITSYSKFMAGGLAGMVSQYVVTVFGRRRSKHNANNRIGFASIHLTH